jgi:uncharacterized membrane protein YbhN (UPF0104 family)
MPDANHEEATGRPSTLRKVLQASLSLVVVLVIFVFVLPQIADYSDVWEALRDMSGLEVTTLILVALWNLVTYWFLLISVLPGLKVLQAAVVNMSSTAVANTLPGGGALGVGVTFTMYLSWGFTAAAITLSVLLSGVWNNFMKLGFPIVALAILAVKGKAAAALVIAAAVGVLILIAVLVVFGLILKSSRLARAVGHWLGGVASRIRGWFHKPPVDWADNAERFRADTVGLLRQRWPLMTGAAFVSHLSLYLVLLVALRHVGVSTEEVGWEEVLAAFAFVRLVSAIPITPGGLGVVELGLAASLSIGLDETTRAQVVAGILVFRALTFFLPVPLGAASFVVWRAKKSWLKTVPVEPSEAPLTTG